MFEKTKINQKDTGVGHFLKKSAECIRTVFANDDVVTKLNYDKEKSTIMPKKKINRRCDQMVRLFFNIWPFETMKISPIMSQIYQSRLSIFPNKKFTVKNFPKWLNFA